METLVNNETLIFYDTEFEHDLIISRFSNDNINHENIAKFGIKKLQPNETNVFNRRNVGFLLIFSLYNISSSAQCWFDSYTLRDSAEAFFPWNALIFITIGCVILIVKPQDAFRLIDHLEKFIDNRKHWWNYASYWMKFSGIFLNKIIRRSQMIQSQWVCIEKEMKSSIDGKKLAYRILLKVVLFLSSVPTIALSYYLYLMTDMGSDAFIVFNYFKFKIFNLIVNSFIETKSVHWRRHWSRHVFHWEHFCLSTRYQGARSILKSILK